ncbi:uncharacterized protein LOC133896430 [Phragmites australis]|uniref:uncharacterized protein LOC133896430 n=1 Tax=Phragmites australis TaxID=29695 RepID=UPI002D78CC1E|nr:uncharacterized protein LOC133896430 [Phragmites australis]
MVLSPSSSSPSRCSWPLPHPAHEEAVAMSLRAMELHSVRRDAVGKWPSPCCEQGAPLVRRAVPLATPAIESKGSCSLGLRGSDCNRISSSVVVWLQSEILNGARFNHKMDSDLGK